METPIEYDDEYTPEHAQAVGVFALSYNALEALLYTFFQLYAPGDEIAKSFLFFSLHNRQRADFIKAVSRFREPAPVADAIEHAMGCFDICAENRNILLHATPLFAYEGRLSFFKVDSKLPHKTKLYEFTVDQIAEATKGIWATRYYVGSLQMAVAKAAESADPQPLELPQRPPKPRKLSLFQRPPVRPDG